MRLTSFLRSMLRCCVVALAASLVVSCSDSTAPRATPPAAGVYVLRTIEGDSLPNNSVWPNYVTIAETLFVSPDNSYVVAGAYAARYVLSFYQVSPKRTFQISGDSVIATALGQGGNGTGGFGAAALSVVGDTLVATYFGGGITRYVRVPTPAPPGPVSSLVLTTQDTLLVQGGALDVQLLVLRGLDANGLWIVRPAPTVSVAAPPGWTLSGSTLTAPATGESEAIIALASGHASTPLTVRSVIDLRTRNWRLSYACTNGLRKYAYNYPPTIFRDSLIIGGPVTSVTYYHPAESDPSPRYDAQIVVDATWVEYLSDGEVLTSRAPQTVTIRRQSPDSLIYPPAPVDYGVPSGPPTVGVVTQQTPRVYTGGDVCSKSLYASSRPVVLAEIP